MKKIFHLFAFAVVAVAFTACHPLDKTYKTLDDNPVPVQATSINITLAASDYKLLPSSSNPYNTGSFASNDEANQYVPTILNSKYPLAGDGSNATVTYNIATPTAQVKLADSLFSDVAYTLTDADYHSTYTDFSDSQVLAWLPTKYPTPAANQLALLTFNYYLNGVTTVQTFSFLYLNGAWKKIYTITPAQYTSIGKGGTYNDFSSSDAGNLVSYFNTFLKADPAIASTAKVGDLQYVSFKYYAGSNFQRVLTLQYNGSNWVIASVVTTGSATFAKAKGVWAGDPTVYYTLSASDTQLIANSTIGTSDQRTDLGKYGDFSGWSDADLKSALILVLTTDFKTPKVNINYKVTYLNYTGGKDVPTVVVFQNNGSAWVAQ